MTNKEMVTEHYDFISPYYYALWGFHIHHGYWKTGKETKEEAQENLTKLLIERAGIVPGLRILDVGCGIGGSSIYLAKNLSASATGITISTVQVEMAKKMAQQEKVDARFELMDAEKMQFDELFDVVWSIEALSHLNDQKKFFQRAAEVLKPGGKFAIIDWFQQEHLTEKETKKYIDPIKKGMLTPHMKTMQEYVAFIEEAGLKIVEVQDISKNVSKTWDICLDIIKNPSLWKLVIGRGKEFVEFLKSFKAMRAGFKSKAFVYGMIIAEKKGD